MPVHPSRHPSSLRVVPATFRPPVAGPAFRLGRSRLPLLGRPTTWLTAAATLSAACAVVAAAPTAASAATTSAFQVGPRPNATRLSFTVGDRITATADVGTGNLELTTSDLSLPGVGQDLTLGLDFNSLLLGSGSPLPAGTAGAGWAMRFGADTRLLANADGSVLYLGPDGIEYLFVAGATAGTYTSPPGSKATLTGNTTSGWKLAEHTSGRTSTFGGAGKLLNRTDRNGLTTTLAYQGYGGSLSKITSTRGTTVNNYTAISINQTTGLLATATQYAQGGGNRNVSYGYTAGRLTSLTDTNAGVTGFGYDSTTGDLTSVTNTGGAVTRFAYTATHKVNYVTQVNATAGSAGNSVTRLAYPASNTTQVADPTTDQAQSVSVVPHTTYTLDASDRVMSTVDADGNARGKTYTTGYDTQTATIGTSGGTSPQSTSTAQYGANSGESLTQASSPAGAGAGASYNNTSAGSQYSPSGGTDAQGNASAFAYDTAGNQTSTSNAAAATASVTYSGGTVATSTDPMNTNNPTVYNVDLAGTSPTRQLTSITPVSGGSLGARTFTYDKFARLATSTDGAGRTTTYGYDNLDRTTSVSYSDATPAVTYAYDTAGRLKTRTDASGTTTYGYDDLNHLTSRANTAGGGTLTYGYDKAGHQSSLTDGRGTTSYTYSPGGQLKSATTGQGTLLQFAYDDHSRRTDTWDATNAANSTWALHSHTDYDTSGRPRSTYAEKTGGTRVADLTYCYANLNTNPTSCSTIGTDDRSLLQSSKDNLTGAVTTYRYDTGNRLTSATTTGGTAPASYSYSYDANGNRSTVTTSGATSTAHFNAANQINDTGNTYDGAGNLTASPTLGTLTYNAAGQMTAATGTPNGNGTYTYADRDQNELVSQTVPGGTTVRYTYGRTDRNKLPQVEQVSIAGTTAYLDHDPTTGQPLAIRTTTGNEAFYVFDGLNRPVALVNSAGTTGTYAYDPYGATTTGGTGSATGQSPYRFAPGSIYDRTTGMLKYGQRWYQPATGRFTQQDSITHLTDPTQGNKYAYAGDDPVNNADPTGLDVAGTIFGSIEGVSGVVAGGCGIAAGLAVGGVITTPGAVPLAACSGVAAGVATLTAGVQQLYDLF